MPSKKTFTLSLLLTLILIFFFLTTNSPPSQSLSTTRRSLLTTTLTSCNPQPNAILNYHCIFPQTPLLSITSLSLLLVLHFYILIQTAQHHFSIVTTKLASHLNLSPSMAAVTLLALGNGSPDVFSSLAALRAGQYRTGFGAILSAGAFVSALVVGFVAIYAAPFSVDPAPFVRDVLFYLTAAMFLFYVYLSAEIFLWQAVGFVAFYLFFVGFVFYMDLGIVNRREKSSADLEGQVESCYDEKLPGSGEKEKHNASGLSGSFRLISKAWELPVLTLLRLTIPQPAPSQWSRFYASANIALCPLALLYACNSFMPLNHPIVFLLPNTLFPLWSVVLMTSFSLAFLHFVLEKEPPKTEHLPVVVVAFVMSVFWISTTAGELVNCLEALGTLLKLSPAFLGLTVLAWGNSVGDLVADVAVAKAGHPAMAMAGCFAGPMFNMLVGLGTALVIQTTNIYPKAYELNFHVGIVIAFVFLLLSLMGSLLVITWSRFRVPRFWGFCLVGLYIAFMALSMVVAIFSS
ncbi:cation/calcium exchanger 5 [Vicia villosa]|uniref:cation/calcium exchanger 5 n=1 Tax=Vicia villosa TaxID=3911 RepID=UPI00273A9957|nr:cation/calcium exchanger 5 [Vicia villosa]XP_058738586.1 cation/calcium exchanger 5 [Vicia villosa]